MESDDLFLTLDWDPSYLACIFDADFYDMSELWDAELVSGSLLLDMVEKSEIYSPLVEDISLDDNVLCHAVEEIESK